MSQGGSESIDADCRQPRCGWLLVIFALALALRAWGLPTQSLTSDEIVEASIARLDLRQIVTYPDGFPPLYHLLLAGWTRLLPTPETGRWLSVLLGMATVYPIYRWARRTAGESAGLYAALLLAVSPLHVYLSQETRAYALYLCLAAFALMYFFEALATDDKRSWAGFVASAGLAVNTHYYAALMAALLGAPLLYYRPRWKEMRRGIAAFAALAVCSLPALALLPGDMAYQADGFALRAPLLPTLGHTAYAFFAGFSLGPSLAELHSLPMREAAKQAAPWVVLFGATGGWLLLRGWFELRRRPYSMGIVYLALASAPVIGVAGSLAGVGPKVRYWSWILLPLLVWLAAALESNRRRRASLRWVTHSALVVMISAQLFAVYNRHADPRYANEDLRGAAEYIQSHASSDAPVFVVSDYLAPPVRYYLNGMPTLEHWLPYLNHTSEPYAGSPSRWSIHPRTEADVRGSLPLDDAALGKWLADLRSLAGSKGKFWLIYSRAFHGDPDSKLLNYLRDREWIELKQEVAGVQLYDGKLHEPE